MASLSADGPGYKVAVLDMSSSSPYHLHHCPTLSLTLRLILTPHRRRHPPPATVTHGNLSCPSSPPFTPWPGYFLNRQSSSFPPTELTNSFPLL